MDLAAWVLEADPGPREDAGDHIMIHHVSRGTSTLWRRTPGTLLPPAIEVLGPYEMWDGADLFSSAFKLAAVAGARSLGGVAITPTFVDLQREAAASGWQVSSGAVPFMLGSGQWLYAATPSGLILEFDLEEKTTGSEFQSLEQVLEEWLENVV